MRVGQTIQFPKAWTMCVVRRKATERKRDRFGTERVRGRFELLSIREQEVLMLRLQAMKYREIANSLGVTVNSVNTY